MFEDKIWKAKIGSEEGHSPINQNFDLNKSRQNSIIA
jgi:hypothetical protein